MSSPLVFDTPIDILVRQSGLTRAEFARRTRTAASTLLKARACDPERGRIHWTTLALIGVQLGIIAYGEQVDARDRRIRKFVGFADELIATRGYGAPAYYDMV